MKEYIIKIEGSPFMIEALEMDLRKHSEFFEIKSKETVEPRSQYSLSFETFASIVAIVSNSVLLIDFLLKQLKNSKKGKITIKTPTKRIEIESSETLSKEEVSKIIKVLFD